jgi:hypothetical protein
MQEIVMIDAMLSTFDERRLALARKALRVFRRKKVIDGPDVQRVTEETFEVAFAGTRVTLPHQLLPIAGEPHPSAGGRCHSDGRDDAAGLQSGHRGRQTPHTWPPPRAVSAHLGRPAME